MKHTYESTIDDRQMWLAIYKLDNAFYEICFEPSAEEQDMFLESYELFLDSVEVQ